MVAWHAVNDAAQHDAACPSQGQMQCWSSSTDVDFSIMPNTVMLTADNASCFCSTGGQQAYLWHKVDARPVGAKLLGQLHEVAGGSLADAVHAVLQPPQALWPQGLLKELGPQLQASVQSATVEGRTCTCSLQMVAA